MEGNALKKTVHKKSSSYETLVKHDLIEYNRVSRCDVSDINHMYKITNEIIGCGINGNVIKCINRKTGTTHALKILNRSTETQKELFLLRLLKSKYVIGVTNVFYDTINTYLVMEYAEKGTIKNYCYNSLGENDIIKLIYQILKILFHIHSNGIVHGDVKFSNILNVDNQLKMCDFGGSNFSSNAKGKTHVFTIPFAAPEVLNYNKVTSKSDIWSLGVMTYRLFYGKYPFKYRRDMSKYDTIECLDLNTLLFPDKPCTYKFKYIISLMLEKNYIKRPDAHFLITYIKNSCKRVT